MSHSELATDYHQAMEEMFLYHKLVNDKGINSLWAQAYLSDEDIIMICNLIKRPGGLVGGKTLDRGNQVLSWW